MTSFDSSSSERQLPPNCDELNRFANARIKEYTKTALIQYDLLYTELARKKVRLDDETVESVPFSDHDVHEVLDRSGSSTTRTVTVSGTGSILKLRSQPSKP